MEGAVMLFMVGMFVVYNLSRIASALESMAREAAHGGSGKGE